MTYLQRRLKNKLRWRWCIQHGGRWLHLAFVGAALPTSCHTFGGEMCLAVRCVLARLFGFYNSVKQTQNNLSNLSRLKAQKSVPVKWVTVKATFVKTTLQKLVCLVSDRNSVYYRILTLQFTYKLMFFLRKKVFFKVTEGFDIPKCFLEFLFNWVLKLTGRNIAIVSQTGQKKSGESELKVEIRARTSPTSIDNSGIRASVSVGTTSIMKMSVFLANPTYFQLEKYSK